MDADTAMRLMADMLYAAVKVSAPFLLITLVVGLLISIVQVVTQIQEMTLTFVPKVAAMLIVLWASMSFMTANLVSFFTDQIVPGIAGG